MIRVKIPDANDTRPPGTIVVDADGEIGVVIIDAGGPGVTCLWTGIYLPDDGSPADIVTTDISDNRDVVEATRLAPPPAGEQRRRPHYGRPGYDRAEPREGEE